jgi:hypothetical protein
MVKEEYNIHYKGSNSMNNSLIGVLATYLPLVGSFGSIIWWGRGIDARLKAVEDWKESIEDRQTRIETKIDHLNAEQTKRIDDCKQTLYNAIMSMKT